MVADAGRRIDADGAARAFGLGIALAWQIAAPVGHINLGRRRRQDHVWRDAYGYFLSCLTTPAIHEIDCVAACRRDPEFILVFDRDACGMGEAANFGPWQ